MPIDLSNHEQLQQLLNNYLSEKQPDLGTFDRKDADSLLADALQGIESAQYLSGRKKKEVETFYDKHPIQATIHDTLNKAPALAGAAIGGQVGGSMLKDYLLNRKIDKAMKGTDKKPGMSALTSQDYEKNPDLQRVFKGTRQAVPQEGGKPDKYQFNSEAEPGIYGDEYQKLNVVKNDLQKPSVTDRVMEGVKSKLPGWAQGHEIFNSRKDERLARLMSQRFPADALEKGELPTVGGAKGVEHFTNIAKEIGGVNKDRAGTIAEEVASRIKSPHMPWKNLYSHVNKPLAIAAGGTALGGMALAPMMSYIQKHVYGKPQVQEWLKNKRMTEGRFEEE